jgi:hypothetical protein
MSRIRVGRLLQIALIVWTAGALWLMWNIGNEFSEMDRAIRVIDAVRHGVRALFGCFIAAYMLTPGRINRGEKP